MTLWEAAQDPEPIRLGGYPMVSPMVWGIDPAGGSPSKGLMQVIEPGFRATPIADPLANMTAAAEYVRSEYAGTWTHEVEIRPRRNGKSSAIERAVAIAETVKPRPEMAEIMERAMADGGPRYAEGGLVSPTGRVGGIPVRLSPGEHVLTPGMAHDIARDMVGRWTGEERAAWDDGIRAAMEEPNEPPDDYPEPPQLPVW